MFESSESCFILVADYGDKPKPIQHESNQAGIDGKKIYTVKSILLTIDKILFIDFCMALLKKFLITSIYNTITQLTLDSVYILFL